MAFWTLDIKYIKTHTISIRYYILPIGIQIQIDFDGIGRLQKVYFWRENSNTKLYKWN